MPFVFKKCLYKHPCRPNQYPPLQQGREKIEKGNRRERAKEVFREVQERERGMKRKAEEAAEARKLLVRKHVPFLLTTATTSTSSPISLTST